MVILLSFTGCENNPVFGTNDQIFDIDLFEQNINDGLKGDCAGYAYVIGKNGQMIRSGSYGLATTHIDGESQMTIDTRITLASVGKFITALGVIRAVNDRNDVDFNSKIGPFLPASFNATDDFKNITIHELLTHTSGIKRGSNDWIDAQTFDSLKNLAANFTATDKSYEYCNKNFSLFRLILPNLLKGIPWTPGLSEEEAYAEVYKTYITEKVLKKAGINNPTLYWQNGYARLYKCPPGTKNGDGTQDWSLTAGAAGWYLSARELASLIAYTWFSDIIITKNERELVMQSGRYYGLDDWIMGEKHGEYLTKGGSLNYGTHAFFVHYPSGIQLTVLQCGNNMNTTQYLQAARDWYDNAWN